MFLNPSRFTLSSYRVFSVMFKWKTHELDPREFGFWIESYTSRVYQHFELHVKLDWKLTLQSGTWKTLSEKGRLKTDPITFPRTEPLVRSFSSTGTLTHTYTHMYVRHPPCLFFSVRRPFTRCPPRSVNLSIKRNFFLSS